VRRDAPVWKHELIIEPHLADLTQASGVVVTEFGPVLVAWTKAGDKLNFQVTVPAGGKARLALPAKAGVNEVTLDVQPVKGTVQGARLVFALAAGVHTGEE